MGISASKLVLGNVNTTASMQKTPKYVMDQINKPMVPAHLRSQEKPVSTPMGSELKAIGGADFMKKEIELAATKIAPASTNIDPDLKGVLDSAATDFLKEMEASDKQSLAPDSLDSIDSIDSIDSMSKLRAGINADDLRSLQSISGEQPQLKPQASALGILEPVITR